MRALVPLVALLAAAFAPGARAADPEAPAAAADEARAAVQRMLGRELPPLEARTFRTPNGVKGAVEAVASPEVKQGEGSDDVVVPIGTALPITCTLYGERLDPGATTWRMAEAVKKGVKLVGFRPVRVAAVAGSALVVSELLYHVQAEKGPMLGQLKLAVYAHDTRSLLCHHDEPGYAETFQRIVAGLAASLDGDAADERAEARFAEIAVTRIGGVPVGYSEHVVWDREGGGSISTTYGSQLLPRSATDLVAVDTYTEETLDAKDLLATGSYVHATNGSVDTQVQLSRGKDGKTFRYEGEKDGKRLAGSFRTKAGLSTDLWFARRFAAKAPAQKAPLRHEAYSFQANPTAAVPVVYRLDPAGPRRAAMELGPIRIAGELDEGGLFARGEMPVGPTTLAIERIWSRGAP